MRHICKLQELGYTLTATGGTAAYLQKQGVKVDPIYKIHEGRPNIEDALRNGDIAMVLLTPSGDEYDVQDGKNLRRLALGLKVTPCFSISSTWKGNTNIHQGQSCELPELLKAQSGRVHEQTSAKGFAHAGIIRYPTTPRGMGLHQELRCVDSIMAFISISSPCMQGLEHVTFSWRTCSMVIS